MRSFSILFALVVALFLAGCGKATRDSAESRFKSARDKINAAAAKNPGMKPAIDAQLIQLDKDFEVARAKTGDEEAIAAISDVASRAENFEKSVAAPAAGAPPAGTLPPPPGAAQPGSKLGGAAPPPGVPAAPAPPAMGGMAPPAPPMGGKLGGAVPAPGVPAAPPAAPAAQGGSGFGGQ